MVKRKGFKKFHMPLKSTISEVNRDSMVFADIILIVLNKITGKLESNFCQGGRISLFTNYTYDMAGF